MSIFATSDTHFGHENIIKYCKRPFKSLIEMDETLIKNWNSVVRPEDTIYHGGDFAFYKDQRKTRYLLTRLNGIKRLVLGNHDKYLEPETLAMFDAVYPYHELEVPDDTHPRGKQLIVLLHYAMRVWNKSHHGSWHLFGHSHGTLADDKHSLSIDVGSDCHNYFPISYQQIKAIMAKKVFKPIDRHGED